MEHPDIEKIARDWLRKELEKDTNKRVKSQRGSLLYGSLVDDWQLAHEADLDQISDYIGMVVDALRDRDISLVADETSELMEEFDIPEDQRRELGLRLLQGHLILWKTLKKRSNGELGPFERPNINNHSPGSRSQDIGKDTDSNGQLLSDLLPAYYDHARNELKWTGQTSSQNELTISEFMAFCGDRPIRSYTRRDVGDFRTLLVKLPSNYKAMRGNANPQTFQQIVASTASSSVKRLADKTIRRHMSALGGLFSYLIRYGIYEGDNPTTGFGRSRDGVESAQRNMWQGEDLKRLISSPVWTGRAGINSYSEGPHIIEDEKFWLPVLALYHGNRLEEFVQLFREDIRQEAGVWFFDIRKGDGRQLKNAQSARWIPLHPFVQEIGFLDYVDAVAADPRSRVFPQLKPGGSDKNLGFYFTKWFSNYRNRLPIETEGLSYHSFRHGFTTRLLEEGTPNSIVDDLTGHQETGTTQAVYNLGAGLKARADAIEKLRWPEVEDILRVTIGRRERPDQLKR